jgi:hypothetical protein
VYKSHLNITDFILPSILFKTIYCYLNMCMWWKFIVVFFLLPFLILLDKNEGEIQFFGVDVSWHERINTQESVYIYFYILLPFFLPQDISCSYYCTLRYRFWEKNKKIYCLEISSLCLILRNFLCHVHVRMYGWSDTGDVWKVWRVSVRSLKAITFTTLVNTKFFKNSTHLTPHTSLPYNPPPRI